jgi:uncharacterized protein YjbI with pentapeptide repeats
MTWFLLAAYIAIMAVFFAVAYRRRWTWTGLAGTSTEGATRKTLWDWLQWMGPLVTTIFVALFTLSVNARESRLDADQRAAQERRLAADAARENTLRDYLAQISDLMLDRRLLQSHARAPVRDIARTATLIALRRLDGARRGLALQFLAEVRLLRRSKHTNATAFLASADLANLLLPEADLQHADLSGANLSGANLSGADLSRADLQHADVSGANLSGADLSRADLQHADVSGANLSGADLSGANLRRANLTRAGVSQADFRGANGLNLADSRGSPAHLPSSAR